MDLLSFLFAYFLGAIVAASVFGATFLYQMCTTSSSESENPTSSSRIGNRCNYKLLKSKRQKNIPEASEDKVSSNMEEIGGDNPTHSEDHNTSDELQVESDSESDYDNMAERNTAKDTVGAKKKERFTMWQNQEIEQDADARESNITFDNTIKLYRHKSHSSVYLRPMSLSMAKKPQNTSVYVFLRSILIFEPAFDWLKSHQSQGNEFLSQLLEHYETFRDAPYNANISLDEISDKVYFAAYKEQYDSDNVKEKSVSDLFSKFFVTFSVEQSSYKSDNLIFPEITYSKKTRDDGVMPYTLTVPMLKTCLLESYECICELVKDSWFNVRCDIVKMNKENVISPGFNRAYGNYLTFNLILKKTDSNTIPRHNINFMRKIVPKEIVIEENTIYTLRIVIAQKYSLNDSHSYDGASLYFLRFGKIYRDFSGQKMEISEEIFYKDIAVCELILIYEID